MEYADRDIRGLDRAGNYYCKHIQAMTDEGLHSKSAIAAELAFRDEKITMLEQELAALKFGTTHAVVMGMEDLRAVERERDMLVEALEDIQSHPGHAERVEYMLLVAKVALAKVKGVE